MPCSKETLVRLFYNVSSSFQLLLLFFYFSSIFLSKLFHSLCSNPIIQRTHHGLIQGGLFSEEEEEEEEEENEYFHVECTERDHLVADIIRGGEALLFLPISSLQKDRILAEEIINSHELEDSDETFATEQLSVHGSWASESEHNREEVVEEEIPTRDTDSEEVVDEEIPIRGTDSVYNSDPNEGGPTSPITIELDKSDLVADDYTCDEECGGEEIENGKVETNFSRDENFLIFSPPKVQSKKLQVQEKDDEEIFGDSCTVGSTSKSSSEWRSSINYRDSATEDPFSSSSRRSCPKWESYTLFQKYDEEMMFLDRISAQKLHETESLRSIQVCPRSISERIVHKLATRNKRSSDVRQNPYHELEAAYVAQICLTWEALNWNYKNFQRLIASRRDFDPGCPGQVAQQFQQFQVLLQRYVENEPYEHGRRPEIYARMRSLAPKLLQVPEYRDSEDEQKEEGFGSRVSSASFLMIMEDGIQTFMSFLKADREKHCQILKAFFKRSRRGSVDPTLLHLMKKANKKKKLKLEDLRRARKCLRKIKLKVEEEMAVLMGLIDLKVISRVLRMTDITEEQLHWCEEKMSKVRVWEGKLQRDSSPLFFPAH